MIDHERELEAVENQHRRVLESARRQARLLEGQRQSLTKQIDLEKAR